ncbi:MAG: hypothetical protein JJ913_00105 [Rhizobiaceae bacterium]|nr:hypothetical protein [Rhizobiaceae bacterium]
MLRFMFIVAVLLFFVAVAVAIFRSIRAARLDWTGILFAAGFVALAFYLRHVTGMSLL